MEPLSPHDPRTIGEFELRALLGAGGMGRVYLGSSRAGRAVAVKVVRPELADDPQFKRRFAREVEAAKSVGGMYTAPVVAAGLDDDPPWLATAFVPGPSLDALVRKHGPLSERATWRLAAGLAEALAAVHACGLVHRDLKPANVLLAADGPHLIDFGISRALEGTVLTASGAVVGTPGYMSPEQAEGKPAEQPSDVFSLGSLLAFASCGKAPFGNGSAPAVLFRVVSGQPALEGIKSPRLRDLIASCLDKDPAKRPDLKSLAATIAERSRDLPGSGQSLTAFWPDDTAGWIRAAQPDLDKLDLDSAIPPYPGNAAPGSASPDHRASPNRRASPDHRASPDRGSTRPYTEQAPRSPAKGSPAKEGTAKAPSPVATLPVPPRPAAHPPAVQHPAAQRPEQQYPAPRYPAPHPAAQRPGGYRIPVVSPVPRRGAATLMRIGAALSFLNMIVGLADIGALKASFIAQHPGLSIQTVKSLANVTAGAYIVGDVIAIALWLWLASAAARGKGWPKGVGTTLFIFYTLEKLATIGTSGFPAGKVLDVAIWIVGLLSLIALWRRPKAPRAY